MNNPALEYVSDYADMQLYRTEMSKEYYCDLLSQSWEKCTTEQRRLIRQVERAIQELLALEHKES